MDRDTPLRNDIRHIFWFNAGKYPLNIFRTTY